MRIDLIPPSWATHLISDQDDWMRRPRPVAEVAPIEDGSGATYYAIYLTPKLEKGAMVAISDTWGHYHSRIVDEDELISYWTANHPDL